MSGTFSKLPDEVILSIVYKLDEDPRHWARLACVSTKFSSMIRDACFRVKCSESIPAVASDVLPSAASPRRWSSLYKVAVCCPGLRQSGVLETSDLAGTLPKEQVTAAAATSSNVNHESSFAWSFHDDLLLRTLNTDPETTSSEPDFAGSKRRKICRPARPHLAPTIWNLSREQGNKLLASRFKGDCLYISDWPGCIHVQEKRNYMLFRGVFRDFKQSRVWRTISDGKRSMSGLECAYCEMKQTWDLHSSFCLRRCFGFHGDGEPVVRAYVCENGHVSGAWTDWPLYT